MHTLLKVACGTVIFPFRYHINLLLNNSLRLTVVIITQNEDQTAKSSSILLIIVMIDKPRAVQLQCSSNLLLCVQ